MGILSTLGVSKIAGEIVGAGVDWFQSKRKVKEQMTTAKIEYLKTEQGFRHAWNLESIKASGKGMRWLSFLCWTAPFAWAFIDPAGAQQAFTDAMGAMPGWYIEGFLMVTGGVWGAKEFATLRETSKERKTAQDEVMRKLDKLSNE